MDDMYQAIIDRLNEQQERIESLSRLEAIATDRSATWDSSGGIVYTDSFGQLTNDATTLAFDVINTSLHVGPEQSFSGIPKLALFGNNAHYRGPHIEAYTSSDVYPLFQQLNWTHDNISLNFDSYFDGTDWRSSDAGSNFQIYKQGDLLSINYNSGTAAGSTISSWSPGIILNTSSNVGIGTISPGERLHLYYNGADGPNIKLDGTHADGTNYLGGILYAISGTNVAHIRVKEHVADTYGLEFGGYSGGLATRMTIRGDGNVGIGTTSPGATLDVRGDVCVGSSAASASAVIEIGPNSSGNRYAFIDFHGDDTYTDFGLRIIRGNGGANTDSDFVHRGTGSLRFYTIDAGSVQFGTSGTIRAVFDSSGHFLPNAAGTYNLGSSLFYWNDVSYKTLTDRGCLAFIPEWELLDGRKVSNLQVFREMKPHATDKTIYGEVKLDYASVPKHAHKPAPIADDDVFEDVDVPGDPKDPNNPGQKVRKLKWRKGDKMGEDGVEMTSVFSMMIGAIRELADENDALKARIVKLEAKNPKTA